MSTLCCCYWEQNGQGGTARLKDALVFQWVPVGRLWSTCGALWSLQMSPKHHVGEVSGFWMNKQAEIQYGCSVKYLLITIVISNMKGQLQMLLLRSCLFLSIKEANLFPVLFVTWVTLCLVRSACVVSKMHPVCADKAQSNTVQDTFSA